MGGQGLNSGNGTSFSSAILRTRGLYLSVILSTAAVHIGLDRPLPERKRGGRYTKRVERGSLRCAHHAFFIRSEALRRETVEAQYAIGGSAVSGGGPIREDNPTRFSRGRKTIPQTYRIVRTPAPMLKRDTHSKKLSCGVCLICRGFHGLDHVSRVGSHHGDPSRFVIFGTLLTRPDPKGEVSNTS